MKPKNHRKNTHLRNLGLEFVREKWSIEQSFVLMQSWSKTWRIPELRGETQLGGANLKESPGPQGKNPVEIMTYRLFFI